MKVMSGKSSQGPTHVISLHTHPHSVKDSGCDSDSKGSFNRLTQNYRQYIKHTHGSWDQFLDAHLSE